jgi:hypothetical protein
LAPISCFDFIEVAFYVSFYENFRFIWKPLGRTLGLKEKKVPSNPKFALLETNFKNGDTDVQVILSVFYYDLIGFCLVLYRYCF